MPVPVIMPKIEMSQETALVLEWLKSEGEPIKQGEALLMVETDKITLEVESPADGVLSGIQVKENDVVPVTTIIAYLLQEGETRADIPAQGTGQVKDQPQGIVKSLGKFSPAATPLAARIAEVEGIELSQVLGTGRNGEITRADVEKEIQKKHSMNGKIRATPAARRAARSADIRLGEINGSGPRGRVQLIDVQTELSDKYGNSPAVAQTIRFVGMRRTIAERMQSSYQSIPHIFLTTSVDMTAIESLRAALNNQTNIPKRTHVSVTALITKYTARTISNFPILNSSLHDNEIQVHQEINLGIAVALDEGLIVPVVKNANQKTIDEIAGEIKNLAEKARSKSLLPADVAGGTFTISNLGPYGIEEFTAIINPGQTGILALGAIIPQPVVVGQQIDIRPIMKITLAVDHRIVDGARASQFLMELKSTLENPAINEG
jgi:pyruvate dehydrogenase E2 component (dihydrolipoamide acetyltransferase)